MSTLAELLVKVGADISEFTKKMDSVNDGLTSAGRSMVDTGKTMTNVGTKLATTVTAPLVGLGLAAVVTGAKFDAQMSKVSAVSGATGKDFDKLREQAKLLGSTTVWSASEAAGGMEFLARAGWDVDEIMSAMPNVLNLATAGAIDLATASDIASNIISGFGDTAQNSQRYIDVMAKATASANTDIGQLGDAMKYVAPVASAMGWSVEETATAIGKMSDAGIQGSQAGTALRAGLLRLASPSKEARDMMSQLNVAMFDAEGQMKSLPDVIGELERATTGMTDEQKAHTLATLFGAEAVSGWMAMLDVGSDELANFTSELENSEGTAQNMADVMGDNLAGAFKGLLSALEGLAISFSDIMTPAIRKATEFITELVRKFDGTDPAVKGLIVVIGLLAASIAPLLIVLGLVMQGLGYVTMAFGLVSTPVLLVIGLVGALIYVFRDELVAFFKTAMDWVQPIMNAFKYLTGGFDQSISDAQVYGATVEDVIGSKAMKIVEIFNKLRTKATELWTKIKETVAPIVSSFVDLVKSIVDTLVYFWEEHGQKLLDRAMGIWQSILDIVVPILQDMVSFVKEKLDMVKQFWDENGKQIMDAVSNVWNFILGVIEFIMPAIEWLIKSVWSSIKGIIDGTLNFIMGLVKVFAGLFTGDFSKMWEGIKQMFFGAIEAVWNYLNLLFVGRIVKLIGSFVKGIITTIKNFGSSFVSTLKGAWDKAVGNVKGFVDNAVEKINYFQKIGANIFQAIKQTIDEAITAAKNTVVNVVKTLVDKATSNFNSMKSTVQGVFKSIKDFIQNPIKEAKSFVLGIIDDIVGAFSKMKITIPKPKLPKISVSSSEGLFGIPVPKFSVNWNAKGGIYNGASILGGGQGVGEAGAEAVLPIQHSRYMAPFARAVADHLPDNSHSREVLVEHHSTTIVELDGKEVGRTVEKHVSRQQFDKQKRKVKGGRR